MRNLLGWMAGLGLLLTLSAKMLAAAEPASKAAPSVDWQSCGWGGGGFYWATAFHPSRDGVLYLAGDVNGVYKSEDHGRHWVMINNGLANYGVYSLATDQQNPETLYAATIGGLCKSTDGGANWRLLPKTGKKDLHLTGERNKSIRAIAVDPTNSKIVYAGSPGGKVFKSTDGGETWSVSYEQKAEQGSPDALRVQFGKANADFFGGFWLPLAFPKDAKAEQCQGISFSFRGEGAEPRDVFLTLKTASGISYRSKNLTAIFKNHEWSDVLLTKTDFTVDPEYAKKNPEQAKSQPTPDWSAVNRLDFACVGSLPNEQSIGYFGKFDFNFATPDAATKTTQTTVREFSKNKTVATYGNVRLGDTASNVVYSVSISPTEPATVLASTSTAGLLISNDSGATWRAAAEAPKKSSSAAVAASDPQIIYASFFTDGVWKSADKGQTWKSMSEGLPKTLSVTEVAVSPVNPLDVYAIGANGWNGGFYYSNDGAKTWKSSSHLAADTDGDPTLPGDPRKAPLSTPTNITINPRNPKQLYISANWRCCWSEDGGLTWTERDRGADISCIYDIRFSGARTYVCAMDEGTLVSENGGNSWKQLWPLKWTPEIIGHNWRLSVTPIKGVDRVIATCSPWDTKFPNRVIVSNDAGKTFKTNTEGLPNYVPKPNTMWGQGYARALATDPNNPQILYLGIDGDAESGKSGGGIFKSADSGTTWKQLPHQPPSRKMFFGLAVDPTNSKRLYWGSCGEGLFRSEDGGESWQNVFKGETWIFNLLVTADGTIYCPGKNLFRSTDHGKTWKQLTKFNSGRTIVAMEVHPADPDTMWFTATTWDDSNDGAVYKTIDGGKTWQEITGNLPYRKPVVLRFNPATNELWAGGVGLYKIKQ